MTFFTRVPSLLSSRDVIPALSVLAHFSSCVTADGDGLPRVRCRRLFFEKYLHNIVVFTIFGKKLWAFCLKMLLYQYVTLVGMVVAVECRVVIIVNGI
ncbi:hypothetical protein FO488_11625 [Geobacter sp. FeAm09]|uniref:hypothetical protein n=1 Tax=Geobacter sp. FeAm09 TaxID=2597769 RepID=UPI0011EDD1F9|nr:hypothetical protein [Geobacter sp. FeAm09]QEM68739.1 hypothetical protein FO488_11625 [Geobacter sp. FeAm09]